MKQASTRYAFAIASLLCAAGVAHIALGSMGAIGHDMNCVGLAIGQYGVMGPGQFQGTNVGSPAYHKAVNYRYHGGGEFVGRVEC